MTTVYTKLKLCKIFMLDRARSSNNHELVHIIEAGKTLLRPFLTHQLRIRISCDKRRRCEIKPTIHTYNDASRVSRI